MATRISRDCLSPTLVQRKVLLDPLVPWAHRAQPVQLDLWVHLGLSALQGQWALLEPLALLEPRALPGPREQTALPALLGPPDLQGHLGRMALLAPRVPSEPLARTAPAGPAGPIGAAGANGAAGPAGPIGAPGANGPAGPAGPVGATGSIGPAGAAGPAGAPGATGPQGPAGVPGTAGAQGPPGANGLTGPAGPTGPTGATGAAGAAGATGAQGPEGEAGPAGPAGAQGPTGPSTQLWASNTLLPAKLVSNSFLVSPPIGAGTAVDENQGGSVVSEALPVPTACTASNFQVEVINAQGSSSATVYLGHSTESQLAANDVYSELYCTTVSNNGNQVSCSQGADTENLSAGSFISILVTGFTNASDYQNASVLVNFTCQ